MEYDPEASEQNRFKIDSKITMKAKDINEERICNPDKL